MRAIYKYPIQFGESRLDLPIGSRFTHFGEQHGKMFAWFEVLTDEAIGCPRVFEVYGTGHIISQYAKWLATMQSGPFVWHLYEHEL